MNKLNLKHIAAYACALLLPVVISILFPDIPDGNSIIQTYQKLLFALPVLFIIAAFLGFRISETGITLASLTFFVLALSGLIERLVTVPVLDDGVLARFFTALPFAAAFPLGLIFLLPDGAGRRSLLPSKIALALSPLILFAAPDLFESLLMLPLSDGGSFPWPGPAASLLPLAAPLFYRDRRRAAFAPGVDGITYAVHAARDNRRRRYSRRQLPSFCRHHPAAFALPGILGELVY